MTRNGPECPKCGLEHDRVDVIRWLWLFRDTKPKPPGKAVGILAMLATRMDAKTGCGWTTDPDLAEIAGCNRHAVQRATRWGRDRLLLHRARKGYRITDERGEKSLWLLTDPATQRRAGAPMAPDPTEHPRDHGSADPTEHPRRPNGAFTPDPTEHQRAAKANPEKLNQEAKSASLRTTRTGGRGPAAATADDDSKTSQPDPRMILAGLGGLDLDDDEIGFIITELGPRRDAGYLLRQIGKDDGKGLAAWIRRKLGRPEPDHRPWCENPRCDHGWIDTDDGRVQKCPNRHRVPT